jgi:hypothetical protein
VSDQRWSSVSSKATQGYRFDPGVAAREDSILRPVLKAAGQDSLQTDSHFS